VSDKSLLDDLIAIYDISGDDGWRTANRHRSYWGKTHTRVHYLEENVVVLAFRPAPDQRWRPWEAVRRAWIERELHGGEGQGGIRAYPRRA
jgi:hypothetical protein